MSAKFDVTSVEYDLIKRIVERAETELESFRSGRWDVLQLYMDITACHCNGCRLRLNGLLVASKFDFVHDVVGISANINRATGKLMNCFLPRTAE